MDDTKHNKNAGALVLVHVAAVVGREEWNEVIIVIFILLVLDAASQ